MGWRFQIPVLVDMGFRVVAPDMMGYGGTVSSFVLERGNRWRMGLGFMFTRYGILRLHDSSRGQRQIPSGNVASLATCLCNSDWSQDGMFHDGNMLICIVGCTQSPAKLDQPIWPQKSFR
jgi:hypothetical protein